MQRAKVHSWLEINHLSAILLLPGTCKCSRLFREKKVTIGKRWAFRAMSDGSRHMSSTNTQHLAYIVHTTMLPV